MTDDETATKPKRTAALLVGWVVGCVLIAGIAAAVLSGGGDDADGNSAAAPTTPTDREPAAPASTSPADAPEVDDGDEGDDEADPAADDSAPSADPAPPPAETPTTTDAPPEPVLVGDGDADGDGVLDDWVSPDADRDAYRPGDEAVDGEFEEDRRIANGCEPAYPDNCVPAAPPVLTCEQAGVSNVLIDSGGDPHGFDTDFDGIGCETKGEGEEVLPPDLDPPSS